MAKAAWVFAAAASVFMLGACDGAQLGQASRQQIDRFNRMSFGPLDPRASVAGLDAACNQRVLGGDPRSREMAEGIMRGAGIDQALRRTFDFGNRDPFLVQARLDGHFRYPSGDLNPPVALLAPMRPEALDFVVLPLSIEDRELDAAAADWCARTGRTARRVGASMQCRPVNLPGASRLAGPTPLSNIIVAYDCEQRPAPATDNRGRAR